ncbi:MAG: hypothetical protein ACR2OA_17315 [Rubripirellula sp.]|jgi:hypothetical protein
MNLASRTAATSLARYHKIMARDQNGRRCDLRQSVSWPKPQTQIDSAAADNEAADNEAADNELVKS